MNREKNPQWNLEQKKKEEFTSGENQNKELSRKSALWSSEQGTLKEECAVEFRTGTKAPEKNRTRGNHQAQKAEKSNPEE